MEITCEHIAANCNPMPQTLQFIDGNIIGYCFGNQVGIYDMIQNRVLININNRKITTKRANCIKVLKLQQKTYIMIGYDSGHLCLFQQISIQNWQLKQTIKQQAAISFIYACEDIVVIGNNNAQISFLRMENQQFKQIDQIRFPLNKIPQSVAIFKDYKRLTVFIGGVDQKIHCYQKDAQSKIQYRFSLSGHQNAITKLSITSQGQDYLLASGSKDGYIRLWKITKKLNLTKFHKNVQSLNEWKIFLDSVLINHQSSVTNLCWVRFGGIPKLASCSLDCTICIWGKEKQQEAWSVDTRMGQLLGNKNAYFNIVTDEFSTYLVAINYIGSAIIWAYQKQTDKFSLRPSFNGHSNEVRDIDWNYSGDFLVSVSMDQTTRVISHNKETGNYHEISRAQIHGYDINAVSMIKVGDGLIDLIACGADEKVIRIMQPPASFANLLNSATKANLHLYFPSAEQQRKYVISKQGDDNTLLYETYAQGGTQVLGLMTKMQRVQRQKITSYFDDEQQQQLEQQQKNDGEKYSKINFETPPHDDYLIKHTLWPQMNKLYGHPHQISALAKCDSRKLLASSCSGLNKTASIILIWNTQEWKIQKMIEHHSYTVYDMKFSPCGKYLASVSKDRKIAVFDSNFQVLMSYEAHSRAITAVAFSPDGQTIATGSRDKIVKLHSVKQLKMVEQINVKKPIYSIQFCSNTLLSLGLQDGTIAFLKWSNKNWQMISPIGQKHSHTFEITSLKWNRGRLASSSKDGSVRIYKVMET